MTFRAGPSAPPPAAPGSPPRTQGEQGIIGSAAVIIPARFGSERLPGKPLLRETGKPLIQHVFEQAREARRVSRVLIATDHEEIRAAAEAFGAEAVMTSPEHPSGTDRVAEVARSVGEDVIINIQGDEPEIDPADVDRLAEILDDDRAADMSTLAYPVLDPERAASPSLVKVVRDARGYALYFSRSPIPHFREGGGSVLGHVGVYGYRREVLLRLTATPPTPLEQAERLEQLRALETGVRIRVGDASGPAVGVDTEADYRQFVERVRAASEAPGGRGAEGI